MNPSKYEIFLKAAETKSFTKTADYFQYTQSAISQAVKSMERDFGITLFLRTHEGLILSAEGESIHAAILEIVQKQRLLEEEISRIHKTQSGTVRLGAYNSISCHWLPGCIQEFQKIYPNIRFDLYQEDDQHLLKALQKGTVDILIISNPTKKEYKFTPLITDPFILVLPPDHPLAGKEEISLRELAAEPFICIPDGYKKPISHMCNEANIHPHIAYNMIDDNAVLAMVEKGFGVSILPKLITYRTIYNIAIAYPKEKMTREIGFITRTNDYTPWAIRKFTEFALKYPFEYYSNPLK